MTQEEKQLLLKDLCARLPYGIQGKFDIPAAKHQFERQLIVVDMVGIFDGVIFFQPYLRPMSSMTEGEKNELRNMLYFGYPSDDYDSNGHRGVEVLTEEYDDWDRIEFDFDDLNELVDWLNAHYFDFRNLIERGLAIDCTNLNIY